MINLKEFDEVIIFKNDTEKLSKLKEWTIISPSAKELKNILYKGTYTSIPVKCDVIGYIEKFTNHNCIDMIYETAVIKIGDEIHKINPMYLKDMQKK